MMQCEHIHGDGARCLTPAMHRRSFCYMHWRQRDHKLAVPPEPELQLPTIDSEASVVLASNQIAHAVLAGKLDTRKARVILACLKIAIDSLRRQQDVSDRSELELTPAMHQELVAPADHVEMENNNVGTDALARVGVAKAPPAAGDATDRAVLTPFQQSAKHLLADLAASAPATIEDLERILDRHPGFTGVAS